MNKSVDLGMSNNLYAKIYYKASLFVNLNNHEKNPFPNPPFYVLVRLSMDFDEYNENKLLGSLGNSYCHYNGSTSKFNYT